MTLRPPRGRSSQAGANAARVAALDYELAQERASALGRLGRALETALAALSSHANDQHTGPPPALSLSLPAENDTTTVPGLAGRNPEDKARARLVRQASEALWRLAVQREACGLRDLRPVLRDYRVPAEVHARMGVFGGP